MSVVVWFCCLFKCHDLLKSINVFGYTVCLEARGGFGKGNKGKDSSTDS